MKEIKMKVIELSDKLKILYSSTKKQPFIVDVPKLNFLMFDRKGHPDEKDFQIACETLFTISYLLKIEIARKKLNKDYKVNPMEVIWDLNKNNGKISFTWTMMIMQPDFITKEMIDEAIQISIKKQKNIDYKRLYLKISNECKCIQACHLGDYKKMNDTLNNMILEAKKNNYKYDQYTHDIYLNDSRKTKPENLKTIMRIKVYTK
jgi:hypothetical protein